MGVERQNVVGLASLAAGDLTRGLKRLSRATVDLRTIDRERAKRLDEIGEQLDKIRDELRGLASDLNLDERLARPAGA